jgi:hypothetical protein
LGDRVLIAVIGTRGQFLKLVFEPTGKIIILRMLMPRHIQSLFLKSCPLRSVLKNPFLEFAKPDRSTNISKE